MKRFCFGRVLRTLVVAVLAMAVLAPLPACESDTGGGKNGEWFGVSGSYYEGPGGYYGPGGWGGVSHQRVDPWAPKGLGTVQSRRYYGW